MLAVGPRRSWRAPAFRRNPRSWMAACTLSAVSGRTPSSPFTTRETVLIDTLDRRATSTMVARPRPDDNVVIALSVIHASPDVYLRNWLLRNPAYRMRANWYST